MQWDSLEKLVVEMVKSVYGGKTSSNLNTLESESVVELGKCMCWKWCLMRGNIQETSIIIVVLFLLMEAWLTLQREHGPCGFALVSLICLLSACVLRPKFPITLHFRARCLQTVDFFIWQSLSEIISGWMLVCMDTSPTKSSCDGCLSVSSLLT